MDTQSRLALGAQLIGVTGIALRIERAFLVENGAKLLAGRCSIYFLCCCMWTVRLRRVIRFASQRQMIDDVSEMIIAVNLGTLRRLFGRTEAK